MVARTPVPLFPGGAARERGRPPAAGVVRGGPPPLFPVSQSVPEVSRSLVLSQGNPS